MSSNVSHDASGSVPGMGSGTRTTFGELASNALGYWEPRRLVYNLALFLVVCAHYYAAWPDSRALMTQDNLYALFFLAVLANVAYCAAYLVDLFVQFAGLREVWARWRWTVLVVGIAFGAVIAHFFMMAVFSSGAGD